MRNRWQRSDLPIAGLVFLWISLLVGASMLIRSCLKP